MAGNGYVMPLYHVTPAENIQNILRCGLEPAIGPRSAELGEVRACVYAFPDAATLEDAMGSWLADAFDPEEALGCFLIDADGLECRTGDDIPGYEMQIIEHIPAERLELLSADIWSEIGIPALSDTPAPGV